MPIEDDHNRIRKALESLAESGISIAASLKRLADAFAPLVVGFEVDHGPQTSHSSKGNEMKLFKKADVAKIKAKATVKTATDYGLLDNGDDTVTLVAVDAAGNPAAFDPSVGTLATVSSDPSIVTVDPPVGLTYAMHAVGKLSVPGTPVNITSTFTFTAGTPAPVTVVDPVDVTAGGPSGFQIIHQPPTSH